MKCASLLEAETARDLVYGTTEQPGASRQNGLKDRLGCVLNPTSMSYVIGVPRNDRQSCRFFSVDVSDKGNATKKGRELFLAEAPESEYDWEGADVAERRIEVFTDNHISIMMTDLLQSSVPPQVVLSIVEKHENVGFYHIIVSFNSGDENQIDYDGRNPHRVRRPFLASSYRIDSLKEIAANRIGV